MKFRRDFRFSRVRIFEIFENLAFQRFEPIIILDFSWRFRKKALEKHISKQMRVYKQITFFYEKSNFLKICFPDRKMDFLRGGPTFGPWSLVPWSLVPGPGPRSLVPGPWSLVPGPRSLVPGPWSPILQFISYQFL